MREYFIVISLMFITTFSQALDIDKIVLPKGFSIEVYVKNVPNAREMAMGDKGTLFVGSRTKGNLYAVHDSDKDNHPNSVQIIAQGLNMPSGIAFYKGSLYVAEVDKILKYEDIESHLPKVPKPQVIYDKLPKEKHHGWKYIDFGPDGELYIPIGAPCNICNPSYPFSHILRLNLKTKQTHIVAKGVRNSVGFDWHPDTKEFWFTDNGRDLMGDNLPPDELNHVKKEGEHFGYPYIHGKNIKDPKYGKNKNPKNFTPPSLELGAHVAALGMKFYKGNMFPKEYKNAIFIAEHGSWNRSKKVGYLVSVVKLKDNKVISYRPFATGWLEHDWLRREKVLGRPAALLELKDGSLLVSDDLAGVIYRIRYVN